MIILILKITNTHAHTHTTTNIPLYSYTNNYPQTQTLAHTEWLTSHDKYEEAMSAYKKAGRADLSAKVLSQLTGNAVSESRFKDAAYYFWMLARESEGDAQVCLCR